MKITQTLPFVATAFLACGFAYSDDLRLLLTSDLDRAQTVQAFESADASSVKDFRAEDRASDRSPRHARGWKWTDQQIAQADATAAKDSQTPQKGDGAKETTNSQDLTANEVLASAKEKLGAYSSVRTKLSEKVAMQRTLSRQTYRFGAKGEYLQGQNLKLKMTVEVKISPELTGRLREICDGELLWSSFELGAKEKPEVTRRDVRQILQAMEQAQQSARVPNRDRELQNASLIGGLGLGGLPALLAGLQKDFEFKTLLTEKIDDRDVWTIEGTWNAKFLEAIRGNKKPSKEKAAEPLPANVPDAIRISFDKETEFPRRIEYLKKVTGQSALMPLLILDFTEPKFNERLNRDEFVFVPPNDIKPRDDTQQFIQRISAMRGGNAPAGAAPQK